MKKHLLLIILLLLNLNLVFSQDFQLGIIWDDEWYNTIEKEDLDNYSFESISNYKSLKKYTPYVNNQGHLPSCVAQSVGYSCLTTMWAIANKIDNRDVITRHAYSALFLYNNYVKFVSKDCKKGMSYYYAFNFLLNKGDILFKNFEKNDTDNCKLNILPTSFQKKRIKDFKRVFNINDNKETKVETTKYYINNNIPVIAGFKITKEMDNNIVNNNNNYYKPDIFSSIIGGHSMLIIGFDDKNERFEVMNSWGKNWGNSGFMYISYLDFATYCKYGFIITLN